MNTIFKTLNDIPERFLFKMPLNQKEYLIDGKINTWDGPAHDVISPVGFMNLKGGFEQVTIGSYPLMEEKQALEALDAAVRAYNNGKGAWPTMPVGERIKHVEKFALQMKEKRTEIVNLLMWEIGKSLADSEKEFDRTIDYIRDTIIALKELDRVSSRFSIEQSIIGQIRRAPLGVVLCMGPFNYPLNETFTTLIPALIMGNTIIFKPPRFGVLLHSPLLELFRNSFPPGVLNTVYGDGSKVIAPLMESGKIDSLAFIGTSRVANILRKQHPKPNRLRCALGLEAKNSAIILEDSDMELTIKECISGSLSFNGQRCTALKILFVHKSIADEFVSKFAAAADALKCGLPWDEKVNITPLPETNKPQFLAELIEDAVENGAKIANETGGEIDYTLFHPAVLFPVNEKMKVYHEEQFGPVVPIVPFNDIETPINYINASNYGQQVSIFGKNPEIIAKLIDPLVNQVCRVNINSQCQRGPDTFPFTGRKDSAEGTLSVSDALRVFSIRTLVAAKESPLNNDIITDIVRNHKSSFLSTDFLL